MAKLSQLLILEGMLQTYDNMNVQDACVIRYQGMCIEGLVDDIIAMLNRLLRSKTRLSSRNVLLANFETMTASNHWLKSKLFNDLPEMMGRMLKEKIEQMEDLLKALMLKIINVEAEYADRFFERVKTKYLKKKHTSDYELWKARQSKLTIERLAEYQAELTANMLIMGVLKYDDVPSGREMEGVDMMKLRKCLKEGKTLPGGFEEECAKLRRYSHWEDDLFIIDYQLLRKYIFQNFGKMTNAQHIAIYEYDVQMKQIHEDMKRLGHTDIKAVTAADSTEVRISESIARLMKINIKVKRKGKEVEEPLFKLQGHWQAVYRILVDKDYCKDSDFDGFDLFINKVMPRQVNAIYRKASVKQISQTDFNKPLTKWRFDSETSGTLRPYERMKEIAQRFQNILEEMGL